MNTVRASFAGMAALMALAGSPSHAANVFFTDLSSITATGTAGALRAGSGWSGLESAVSPLATIVDGAFLPNNQQWTQGTYWWDEALNPQGPPNVVTIEITLNSAHTVNRFVLQGDNNENYLIDWWDGSAWQNAYSAPQFFTDGIETRDSGVIAAVTADRFRVSATGGDLYYSLSEVQAFDAAGTVPEPGGLALATLALGVMAVGRRRGGL